MSSPGSVPERLSEWLSQISDNQLSLILRERLDNLFPMPVGSGNLAARLASPFTVRHTVEALDMLSSACLEAMAHVLDGHDSTATLTVSEVYDCLSELLTDAGVNASAQPTERDVLAALGYLSVHGIVWGLPFPTTTEDADMASSFRVVPEALESRSSQCAFIEPPLPVGDAWSELVNGLTEHERRVLHRLHDAGGRGVHSPAKNSDPSAPVPHLISLGLLEVYDAASSEPSADVYVRLPLRVHNYVAGRHENFVPTSLRPPKDFFFPPPPVPVAQTADDIAAAISEDRAAVSSAAVSEVALTLAHMREVLRFAAHTPFKALRNGEIGVRELRRAEKELSSMGVTRAKLVFIVELARGLGFLDWGDPDTLYDDATYGWWAPTRLADEWMDADAGTQWAILAMGWFGSLGQTWLVGKDADGKNVNVFDEETASPGALVLRRQVLLAARGFDPLTTGAREDTYTAYGFMYPQHVVYMDPRAIPDVAANAEHVGLLSGRTTTGVAEIVLPLFHDVSPSGGTNSTAMADYVLRLSRLYCSSPAELDGAGVVDGESMAGSGAAAEVSELSLYDHYVVALIRHCQESFPAASSTLIAQGDMTVLAPGPLDSETGRVMDRIAEVESPGLATLYRVSEDSIRRGMVSGLTPDEMSSFLSERVLNGVPQAVTYLINDVGRLYGSVRGGAASCYVCVDDPQVMDDVVASPVASSAGLRMIAPTVLVGSVPLAMVLRDLSAAGFHVMEVDAGGVAVQSGSVARCERRVDRCPVGEADPLIRYSCTGVSAPEGGIPGAVACVRQEDADDAGGRVLRQPQDWVAQLSECARSGMRVMVTCVGKDGATHRYRLEPLTVRSGYFDGIDVYSSEVRRVAFHHVTSISLLER